MIDYEKLKLAYELVEKSSTHFIVHTVSGKYPNEFTISSWDNNEEVICDNLDHLITKLCQLTHPKAKYQPGDKVWIQTNLVIIEVVVSEINQIQDGYYFLNSIISPSVGFTAHEDDIYPTKQSLIEAQIEYWQKLRDEPVTEYLCDKVATDCQHESNGLTYMTNPPQNKCLKCWEFYR